MLARRRELLVPLNFFRPRIHRVGHQMRHHRDSFFVIDIIRGLSNNPALFFLGTVHDAALINI